MSNRGIDHVALCVESLTQAENLYCRLFDMTVVERRREGTSAQTEIGTADEGECARMDASVLEGAGFRLALHLEIVDYAPQGRLGHICVRMTAEQQDAFLARAESLGCLVRERVGGGHTIEDPYEVRWEIVNPQE